MVTPLSHFVVQGKVNAGDLIFVDVGETGFRFHRQKAGANLKEGANAQGGPEVKWVRALISSGDDGGEKEELTEEVAKAAAEAAGGRNVLGSSDSWTGGNEEGSNDTSS